MDRIKLRDYVNKLRTDGGERPLTPAMDDFGGSQCDKVAAELGMLGKSGAASTGVKLVFVDPKAPEWVTGRDGLEYLRYVALQSQRCWQRQEGDVFVNVARRWVTWLCEESLGSRYLSSERAADDTFYMQDRITRPTLVSKKKSDWGNGWDQALKWLTKPEELTIAECELALAIFDWNSDTPRLVEWIKSDANVLHRVHLFLLKRYCTGLLKHFRRACKIEGVDYEGILDWYPRIAALCGVGTIAVLDADALSVAFFPDYGETIETLSWQCPYLSLFMWVSVIVALGCGSIIGMHWLLKIDIRKQSRGLLPGAIRVDGRIRPVSWRFFLWGVVGSCFIEYVFWLPASFDDWNAHWPVRTGVGVYLWLGAVAGRGVLIALIGSLLQWLFEDRAATEPL